MTYGSDRSNVASRWSSATLCLCLALVGPASAQRSDAVSYAPIAGSVYLVSGGGGANISLSAGPDGILMVDSKGPDAARQILEITAQLSAEPIKFIINGHEHPDHTDGNEFFGDRGVTIIASQATYDVLAAGQRGGPPAPPSALPVMTIPEHGSLTLHFNGEEVEALHVTAAHAPGNSIVHYKGSNVLHVGDLFSPTRYPIIAGGTFEAFIEAMNIAIVRSTFETVVVPGSGPLSDREGMIAFREMLLTVRDRANTALDNGISLEQFVASRPTREFDRDYGDPGHALFLPVLYEQMAARRN